MKNQKFNWSIYLIVVVCISVAFVSCKNKNKTKPSDKANHVEKKDLIKGDFEGVIYYEFNNMGRTSKGKYMIKDNRLRIEYDNGNTTLFLPEKNGMIMLLEGKYMEVDLTKGVFEDKSEGGAEKKITGETKTIAGHECEVWEITAHDGTHSLICMARGLGNFLAHANPLSGIFDPEWAAELEGKDFMPLEVVTTLDGGQKITMKAVKIEEKILNDSLFKIPEGYEKVELPKPGRGMN